MSNSPNSLVVVGGGAAGLAAATYLARGGRTVTLLERAPTLGGRAASDRHSGYALNRGAHALYTGGDASRVLAELGVSYTFGVPRGIAALDSRGLHAFPATPGSLLRTTLLDAADKLEFVTLLARLAAIRAASLADQALADWIDSVARRPRVRQLLGALARVYVYSSALDVASADVFVAKLQQTTSHPIHYIDGGWQTLVDGLASAATAAGAQVLTSASVAAFDFRDDAVVAVQLHDGRELPVSHVVLAVPPHDAVRLIGKHAAAHLAQTVEATPPALVACLDVALEKLPTLEHPVVFDVERPLFLTAQSRFARVAPPGGAVVHAFKCLDPRAPSTPERDREELAAFLDQMQPGWRDVVIKQQFLPRMLGAGLLPTAAQSGLTGRPGCDASGVPNVYLAGDWVGSSGYLVDAALASARAAAQAILARPARAEFAEVAVAA